MADATDGDIRVSNEISSSVVEECSLDQFALKPVVTKKVPHYLRASTGSCHEACKYGHPHKTKEKPMLPVRRRVSKPLADVEKTVDIHIYVDEKVRKKVQLNKVEFPTVKELASADGNAKKSVPAVRRSPVRNASGPVKEGSYAKSASPKIPKVISNKVVQSSEKSSDTSRISKIEAVVKKSAPSKRIPLYPKERNALVGPLKSNVRGLKQPQSLSDTMKTSNAEVAKKYVPSKRIPVSSEAKNGSEGPLKPKGDRGEKPPSVDSFARFRGKPSSEPRAAVGKTAASSASVSSSRTSIGQVKRPLHPTTVGIGLKGQSQSHGQGTQVSVKKELSSKAELKEATDDQNVEEKTLHMIETKEDDDVSTTPNASLLTQSPSPLSPESLNSSTTHEVDEDHCNLDSEYSDSEADGSVSNYNSSGDSKPADTDSLKEGKAQTHDSEGPFKLTFRKGTVVEEQSEANNAKRLHFRQGRTLGEDSEDQDTEVVKVVLKHQDTEMKKDDQVLLNNVIEETASKLVEKRKSKVKALVGAFESVISLQDRKPSAASR